MTSGPHELEGGIPGVAQLRHQAQDRFESLIYKHEDYEEWVWVKMVRSLDMQASLGVASALGECQVLVQCTVKGFDDTPSSFHFSLDLKPSLCCGVLLDLILVHIRAGGKFTENELILSMKKWTFQGEVMYDVRTRCLASFRTPNMFSPLAFPPVLVLQPDQPEDVLMPDHDAHPDQVQCPHHA